MKLQGPTGIWWTAGVGRAPRQSDLAIGFLTALLVHAAAAACIGNLVLSEMSVVFPQGESGLELTFISAPPRPEPPPPQPEAPPEPQRIFTEPESDVLPPEPEEPEEPEPVPEPERTAPEPEPEPEPAPQPERQPAEVQPEPAAVEAQNPPADATPDRNGDPLEKGVEGPVQSAWLDSFVRPVYPLGARMRGEEGAVRLNVRVDAKGRAVSVEISQSSGYSSLDHAALKALRRARFVPAREGEQTREAEVILTIRFQLKD